MLNEEFLSFNLEKLAKGLNTKNDLKFKYLGIQVIQDRYLLRDRSTNRDIYSFLSGLDEGGNGTCIKRK